MKRLVKWGYYLFLARRSARRSDKWSDLYLKNSEVTALDVSEAHYKLAEAYLERAERLYE